MRNSSSDIWAATFKSGTSLLGGVVENEEVPSVYERGAWSVKVGFDTDEEEEEKSFGMLGYRERVFLTEGLGKTLRKE